MLDILAIVILFVFFVLALAFLSAFLCWDI
jgi:hypothetical protein